MGTTKAGDYAVAKAVQTVAVLYSNTGSASDCGCVSYERQTRFSRQPTVECGARVAKIVCVVGGAVKIVKLRQ